MASNGCHLLRRAGLPPGRPTRCVANCECAGATDAAVISISLVAGVLGFTNVASGAAAISKVLFFIAITIFLIVLVFGVLLGTLAF